MAIKTDRDLRKSEDFRVIDYPREKRLRRGYVEDRDLVADSGFSFFAVQNLVQVGLVEVDGQTPLGKNLFRKEKALKRLEVIKRLQQKYSLKEIKEIIYNGKFDEDAYLQGKE